MAVVISPTKQKRRSSFFTIGLLFLLIMILGLLVPKPAEAADLSSLSFKSILSSLSGSIEKSDDTEEAVEEDASKVVFRCKSVDGETLSGAEITVYDDEKEIVFQGTTNSKGRVAWKNPETGNYTFVMTKAPQNFEIDSEKREIKITAAGKIKGDSRLFTVREKSEEPVEDDNENKEDNNLSNSSPDNPDNTEPEDATNTDNSNAVFFTVKIQNLEYNTNEGIEGSKFIVFNGENKEVASGTTDANGEFLFDVPAGEYTFNQTSAPTGYSAIKQDLSFKVSADGKIEGQLRIISKPVNTSTNTDNTEKPSNSTTDSNDQGGSIYSLSVSTVSAINDAPLLGAEVTLSDEQGKVVATQVSDATGVAHFSDLPVGKYTIQVTKGADGYYASSAKESIEIGVGGGVSGETTLKCSPQGTVVLTVTDRNTGGIIEGVEIAIYDENDNEVLKEKTDADGKVYFQVPNLGKYTFKETSVPSGYSLNTNSYSFTVADGFKVSGDTAIDNVSNSSGSSVAASNNGSSNRGSGSTSNVSNGTANSSGNTAESVPQTGIPDNSILLLSISLVLLLIAITAFYFEKRRKADNGIEPDMVNKEN